MSTDGGEERTDMFDSIVFHTKISQAVLCCTDFTAFRFNQGRNEVYFFSTDPTFWP